MVKRKTIGAIALLAAALAVAAASGCDTVFGPQYDPDSEGTKENPIEIGREVHRGRVGNGGGTLSGSYYTFVSDAQQVSIYYDNLEPDDDLDCFVYTDPDFHSGFVTAAQDSTETHCDVFNYGQDFTGVRFYVNIVNYSDENPVVEYDIYYK